MKRTGFLLLLGLVVGVATHAIYFHLNRPAGFDSLEGQLTWIKTELNLSDVQYARVKELHEASSPRLRALAAQVAQMQTEFAAFETTRRTSDRVDFLEFAQFVETRRAISKKCLESTRQLVLATAEVMNPRQRERYLGIVTAADPLTGRLIN